MSARATLITKHQYTSESTQLFLSFARLLFARHSSRCVQAPWVSILITESSARRAKRRRPPSRRIRTFGCSSSSTDSLPDEQTLSSMEYVTLLSSVLCAHLISLALPPQLHLRSAHLWWILVGVREMKITLFGSSLKLLCTRSELNYARL
jgi:hypothetical protein